MENKPKGFLPKFELIIILVFLFSFAIWAVPRCGEGKEDPPLSPEELEAAREDSLAQQTAKADTVKPTPTPVPRQNLLNDQYTRLYVTIDGLNLRTEPDLKSDVIVRLPLFEEVWYMNEVTDSTYVVNLGYEEANEPYVKVRTQKGHVGWVYGAGVHYVKKKRQGVLN